MTYVIAEPCVDVMDRSCVDECPVDCIYQGDRKLYIHPRECIDCGACTKVCPVDAVYFDQELPQEWEHYARADAAFFDSIGSPGGARGSALGGESAVVAALPVHEIQRPYQDGPPLWRTVGRVARRWLR